MSAPKNTPSCLITGAAKRLGRSIALGMARSGWNVVIHYDRSETQAQSLVREIEALGRNAIAVKASLDDPKDVRRLFEQAREWGGLRCVVNNASRFHYDQPQAFDGALALQQMQSNLVAPLLLTQMLFDSLKSTHQPGDDPAGVCIQILDQKLFNPNPDFFSYTLSKAALLESVRLCAMAMAPVLRVVGIAPGITLPSADQTQAEFEAAHALTPLGASSRPDEIADAVCWISQARAVTGTVLLVDGGQHLAASPRDVMMMVRTPAS